MFHTSHKDPRDGLSPREDRALEGMKVLFLGSSVTFGSASGGWSIPEYFAARLGWDVLKEAVSGTTLADLEESSYVSRLRRLDPKRRTDLLICQLSTNDATRGLPLGSIAPGEEGSFDPSTVTGAMETVIAYARDHWGCPVAFYTGSRFDCPAYEAMVDRLKELREKWGILILDLWSDEDFNALTDRERARYMADPIHPTLEGYCLWWCPELERQLTQALR